VTLHAAQCAAITVEMSRIEKVSSFANAAEAQAIDQICDWRL